MGLLYKEYLKTYRGLSNENSEGYLEIVEDLLETDEVKSLEQYEQHFEINRLQHVISVSYLTYIICKKFNLDYNEATRAAIMHDLVYYDWRNGETGGWHKNHGYKHPKYACFNAKELCGDISKLQWDIILKHMWPLTVIPPKYKEGFVVTFSDKYCATREVLYSFSKKYKDKFLRDVEENKNE